MNNLQRELTLVAESPTTLPRTAVATAINLVRREAARHLKLRSNVRGTGRILGNRLEVDLTIPLDSRYNARNNKNADTFNNAVASGLRKSLNAITPNPRTVAVSNQATGQEIQTLLGGLGAVILH